MGAARFLALIQQNGSPTEALARHTPPRNSRPKAPTSEGLALARWWLHGGGRLLFLGGPAYPTSLLSLGEPPPVLFIRGDPAYLSAPSVALVGGRLAGEESLAVARSFGARCARCGLVVVSGGARGIDAAALDGALDAGGAVVVVLGCGIDVAYPPEHQALFSRCSAQGALVSELLPGAPPLRSFFVTRNRILAALAGATLLVWGKRGSGALVTARWAVKLGRRCGVLAHAGGVSSGALAEALKLGATALDDERAAEVWLTGVEPRTDPSRAVESMRFEGGESLVDLVREGVEVDGVIDPIGADEDRRRPRDVSL